jgi:hypothetical protein
MQRGAAMRKEFQLAGTLTFPIDDRLRSIINHAMSATTHRQRYGETDGAGLWLVKDQGVYLMSNGDPAQVNPDSEEGTLLVHYAKECDPTSGADFDEWYDNGREIMGGDDCVEFIPLDSIVKAVEAGATVLTIKVTARNITVLTK